MREVRQRWIARSIRTSHGHMTIALTLLCNARILSASGGKVTRHARDNSVSCSRQRARRRHTEDRRGLTAVQRGVRRKRGSAAEAHRVQVPGLWTPMALGRSVAGPTLMDFDPYSSHWRESVPPMCSRVGSKTGERPTSATTSVSTRRPIVRRRRCYGDSGLLSFSPSPLHASRFGSRCQFRR
jgi:hypothetical protein